MFVQMVDVFDDTILQGAGEGDVVEKRQVLDVFAQANATGVRADGHAELGGQQQDGKRFVHPAQAAGVDLAEADGIGLKQLLEQNAIGAVFAGTTVISNDPSLDAVVKTASLGAMIVVIHMLWLVTGASLSRALRDPVMSRVINLTLAGILVVTTVIGFIG